MKSFMLRPCVLLAVVLGLAGCGGKAEFEVKGTITGLAYGGMVLTNGSDTLNVPAPSPLGTPVTTSFVMPRKISYGDTYNVVVTTNPDHETCGASGGSDSAGRLASINVVVQCTLISHAISVTLNQVADGLVLTNGSNGTAAPAAGTVTTAFTVPYGASYGITVLTQPTNGTTCTVQNGTGVMGDADILDKVKVTCT